jgi:hypothetical protein
MCLITTANGNREQNNSIQKEHIWEDNHGQTGTILILKIARRKSTERGSNSTRFVVDIGDLVPDQSRGQKNRREDALGVG